MSCLGTASSTGLGLDRILEWGEWGLVEFGASGTQFLPISATRGSCLSFGTSMVPPFDLVNMLGITVASAFSWQPCIAGVAGSASGKLGVLFGCRSFSSEQLQRLCWGLVCPCVEFCSHIWGDSSSVSLLDRVELTEVQLVSCPRLTSKLGPLALHCGVGFGFCFRELAVCVPPPLVGPCSALLAAVSHDCCVAIGSLSEGHFDACSFPCMLGLWSFLPFHVFPDTCALAHFGEQVFCILENS